MSEKSLRIYGYHKATAREILALHWPTHADCTIVRSKAVHAGRLEFTCSCGTILILTGEPDAVRPVRKRLRDLCREVDDAS